MLIRHLDVIQVDVFGVEELSREVQVNASGAIDYPLIGQVDAVGRTTDELAFALENAFRGSYIRNPDVTTRIIERSEQLITVGGEVARPGRYPVTQPISLMEAISIGGGMGDYAQREEVLVFRTVGEERYVGVYNMRGIALGNYADPMIYPDDIVMVGNNPARRRLERILQITASIVSPLILIERALR